MTDRENRIRAWRSTGPDWIPITSGLPWLDWTEFGYDEAELEALCMKHPILFPGYSTGAIRRNHEAVFRNYPDLVAGNSYTDGWGCVWKTPHTGMVGGVAVHPLEDWAAFAGYGPPDIEHHDGTRALDWGELAKGIETAKREGWFTGCGLPHGHTFLRAQDIRGYMNAILDMADEEPRFVALLEMLTVFNEQLIQRFIALAPDSISIAEDLGMQNSPMLSAEQFRQFIAPCYERLTRPVKRAGIIVHEHSDGFILPLLDDIVRTGGDVLNLQDLVNGIDNIGREAKGRIAIDLDIDRQHVTVSGSPADIDDHIRECVTKLGSKAGGLSLTYQPWPPTPVANLDATFGAMEKYCVTDYLWR